MPENAAISSLGELENWLREASLLDVVEDLARRDPDDRAVAFRLLPRDRALAVFESMDLAHQQEILRGLRAESFRQLLEDLDPDDRARLLGELPAKVVTRALQGLSPAERAYTAALLGYPDGSAGRVMTPEMVSVRESTTVGVAIDRVRASGAEAEALFVLPVTDEERHLVGSVDLPTLLRASPDTPISAVMSPEVFSVRVDDDQETAARLIADANLASLPVVDTEGRLVGLITVDDAVRILEEEETEDRLRAGGGEPLRRPYGGASILHLARARAAWLLLLAVGATLTVNVMDRFEATLASVVTLAVFVPLLIGTGGNAGSQAATVVVRALSLGDVRFSDLPRIVGREAFVGVVLGAMLSALAFGPVAFFFDTELAAVVSLTLLAVCTWATMIGSLLPLVADRLGIDPAVASTPVVSTLVDATGLVIYFLIARAVLGV